MFDWQRDIEMEIKKYIKRIFDPAISVCSRNLYEYHELPMFLFVSE